MRIGARRAMIAVMRTTTLALTGALAGCAPEAPRPQAAEPGAPPEFVSTRAGCEGPIDDEVWVFGAEVTDADGPDDVREVTAFVYDEVSDRLAGEAALGPAGEGYWEVVIPEAATTLDCDYLRYSVDFVAVDASGEAASVTTFVQAGLGP
jgi:hypothetical protein